MVESTMEAGKIYIAYLLEPHVYYVIKIENGCYHLWDIGETRFATMEIGCASGWSPKLITEQDKIKDYFEKMHRFCQLMIDNHKPYLELAECIGLKRHKTGDSNGDKGTA